MLSHIVQKTIVACLPPGSWIFDCYMHTKMLFISEVVVHTTGVTSCTVQSQGFEIYRVAILF